MNALDDQSDDTERVGDAKSFNGCFLSVMSRPLLTLSVDGHAAPLGLTPLQFDDRFERGRETGAYRDSGT